MMLIFDFAQKGQRIFEMNVCIFNSTTLAQRSVSVKCHTDDIHPISDSHILILVYELTVRDTGLPLQKQSNKGVLLQNSHIIKITSV